MSDTGNGSKAGDGADVDRSLLRRVTAAAGVGTLVEFFDYASYAYLASTLSVVFFPAASPTTALLNTFAVFAVSFIMRPIGALVWGNLGDRLGRRRILAVTIVIMSASTLAVGLVPSHATIGIAAPVLLLILRMTQSFSAAGEYSGASTFIVEYAPAPSRGRYTSVVPMAAAAGFLLASLCSTVLYRYLSEGAMVSWGWRVPFVLAAPMGLVGLYIRRRLEDTPRFTALVERRQVDPTPIRSGFRKNGKAMFLLFLLIGLNAGGYYLLLAYTPTYLVEQVGLSNGVATLVVTGALGVYVFMVPVAASLSDRIGRRRTLIVACVLFLLLTWPALRLLSTAGAVGAFAIVVGLLGVFALNDGVFPAFLGESFTTTSRFTGFALPFNLGNAIFGGTMPYVATWLIDRTGSPLAPAYYLMVLAVVALLALAALRETSGRPLRDTDSDSDAAEAARN